jgi:hypothetical protein
MLFVSDRDEIAPVIASSRFDCYEGSMRKFILMIAVLAACSKTETAKTDTAAPAMAPPPAAPAALTATDLSGTWKGTTMAEQGDSVISHWTVVSPNGSDSKFIVDGQKDSVAFTTVLDADSMVATSVAYNDPNFKKAGKVMFRSVGRLKDGKLTGTAAIMLATKPDSVLSRTRWEATKTP